VLRELVSPLCFLRQPLFLDFRLSPICTAKCPAPFLANTLLFSPLVLNPNQTPFVIISISRSFFPFWSSPPTARALLEICSPVLAWAFHFLGRSSAKGMSSSPPLPPLYPHRDKALTIIPPYCFLAPLLSPFQFSFEGVFLYIGDLHSSYSCPFLKRDLVLFSFSFCPPPFARPGQSAFSFLSWLCRYSFFAVPFNPFSSKFCPFAVTESFALHFRFPDVVFLSL